MRQGNVPVFFLCLILQIKTNMQMVSTVAAH